MPKSLVYRKYRVGNWIVNVAMLPNDQGETYHVENLRGYCNAITAPDLASAKRIVDALAENTV